MNQELLEDLIRDEGCVKNPRGRHILYEDSLGHETIGYGRLMSSELGGGIEEGEAIFLLRSDIVRTIVEMDATWPWAVDLSDDQRRGLANMLFNLGAPRLSKFSLMLAALEKSAAGDQAAASEAASEATRSRWAVQVGERSARVALLLKSG